MNLGQLETALERYGFDPTDPLTTWINAAMHEMESSFDWPWMEEVTTVQVQPAGIGQPCFISVPNDFSKIITVFDKDHLAKIKYWSRRKFRRLIQDETDQGLPEVYTILNMNTVQVWRCPQTVANIEVTYQATTPDLVNAADVPTTAGVTWPLPAHYPIVARAASIALQAENEEDRAKTAQEEYERMLLSLMGKYSERELDEPEAVEDTQGYGSDMSIRGLAGY